VAALDFQERHDRAWDEQEDEAELLTKAIGPRYYGEDELRECGKTPAVNSRRKNPEMTTACSYL